MNSIEYSRCRLLSRVIKYGGYLELEIEHEGISLRGMPGHFVMIRGWSADSPILSRPFDILEPNPERRSFKLVIKIVGEGTRQLTELTAGEEVTVLGPLGRGGTVPELTGGGKIVTDIGLLVRGVGAAAVVLLAQKAQAAGIRVHTFLTAGSEETLVCRDYLSHYSDTLTLGWDDPAEQDRPGASGAGQDGRELVRVYLADSGAGLDVLYTCGSKRFGRFVQELDADGTTEGYLFMESRMACGLGDCHGCTVETSEGDYVLVCQDGPIFPAGRIKL